MKFRHVRFAELHDEQGCAGFYVVRLTCGHTIRCEVSQLSSYMCCLDCEGAGDESAPTCDTASADGRLMHNVMAAVSRFKQERAKELKDAPDKPK